MSQWQFPRAGTRISLGTDVPVTDERRSDSRTLSIFRVAKLMTETESLCVVRNISSGGLMTEAYEPLTVEQTVRLQFASEITLTGTVVWQRERMAGIRFDAPVDIFELLRPTAQCRPLRFRDRAPRITVSGQVELRAGSHYHRAQLCDISQGGAKLILPQALRIHEEIVLRAGTLDPLRGNVRWQDGAAIGVAFQSPVPLELLSQWTGVVRRAAAPDKPALPPPDHRS
ncbi:PilZ domain-containing protein [Sphingomonas sp. AR_OL41]|uniref:PilZ domain-containing protein n=1 Tax=Sphingomonas sp. AR_OL41 TaxID=3042729 RepID=UPI0024810B7F|nr:PilZ domain-containing protein [Sphingomonas sp. AR_OL41]MDH7975377.1 PilZ domain-containing protein [Sphingomonas sp. AR_OL41]